MPQSSENLHSKASIRLTAFYAKFHRLQNSLHLRRVIDLFQYREGTVFLLWNIVFTLYRQQSKVNQCNKDDCHDLTFWVTSYFMPCISVSRKAMFFQSEEMTDCKFAQHARVVCNPLRCCTLDKPQ